MASLERQLVDGERISVIPNFLSVIECQELIARAEESGFKLSVPSGKVMGHVKACFSFEYLHKM